MSYKTEDGDGDLKRAQNYFRCPVCGEPQLVEKTLWPAPGVAHRYRRCLNGHDATATEERAKKPRK